MLADHGAGRLLTRTPAYATKRQVAPCKRLARVGDVTRLEAGDDALRWWVIRWRYGDRDVDRRLAFHHRPRCRGLPQNRAFLRRARFQPLDSSDGPAPE